MIKGAIFRKGELTFGQLLDEFRANPDIKKAGAIAAFIGVVRGVTKSGEKVVKLELEAWEEKANETLTKICEDLCKRPGIVDVAIRHAVGELEVGDDIVYVIVAGAHRDQVFPVLVEAVNRYKKEAEVWKKEYLSSGVSYWVSELESSEESEEEQ
ncbi:MAG: molybdenum cofactor biosynthesis protein MoaE [Candidatus Odinarchaeia archaeon]